MAAKKKQRKNTQPEKVLDNETMVYIYAIILIMLTIIGALQMGFVGEFLSSLCRFLFGSYHGVVYGVFFVYAMIVLFKKQRMPLKPKTMIGLAALLLALILWSAIPQDNTLLGFDVLKDYLAHTPEHFSKNPTVLAQGGVVGAVLYSISSMMVDRQGTWVFIIGLILLALILLVHKEWLVKGKESIRRLFSSFSLPKQETEKEQEEELTLLEEEPIAAKPKTTFFNRMKVDEVKTESSFKKKSIFLTPDDVAVQEQDKTKPVEMANPTVLKDEPVIKNSSAPKTDEGKVIPVFQNGASFRLPPLSLLDNVASRSKSTANAAAAQAKGKRLIEILQNFGITATLVGTHIGPAVTKFEIRPDSSVKVNRIMNISDNIKMELAARDIRIEAPIPGRNAVGIEVPNVETTMVKMLELMKNIPAEKKDKKMMFILGKDLMGRCVYCDLDKMPHLLIAGATGSGKSVCMNTIITSFILRTRPDEVKLLLVDPKKVEFTPYHGIPHLIGPVISDANEASRALKVIVEMMENRFEVFSQLGVRNIASYNEKVEKEHEEGLQKMQYIVVIIDELADLMMVAGKEVEMSIQRITQLARAAGIHLIVATQRPSTDVITGIIKANIPSRISFSVSSGIDSRTILDSVGAERLLGNGDMLYLPIGEPSAIRLQGVYVRDEEVKRIADFVSRQYKPFYEDAFIRLEGVDNNEATAVMNASDDPMYEEIKEYVIEAQKASTSLLQRRFGLGYNRAARMIDVLEERGVIGPAQGSKPREVYIKKQEE